MDFTKVFKSYLKTPFLILLLLEILIYFGAVYSAAYLRFAADPVALVESLDGLWIQATIVAVVTPMIMLTMGLYQGQIREGMAGVLLRMVISTITSAAIVSIIMYMIPSLFLGRGIMAITYLLAFFVVGTIRAVFLETADSKIFKNRVLVYGAGETASHIDLKLRRQSDRRGFEIIGYVKLKGQKQAVKETQVVSIHSSLLEFAIENKIDEIVVAANDVKREIKVDDLVNCKLNGIEVLDILSFFEREAGQVRIDLLDPSWLVTSDGFRQSIARSVLKRFFDVSASLIVLVATLPVMCLTAIAIWIEDGVHAPLLYSQVRVGQKGVNYKVYKFRSMHVNAEKDGQAVWASATDSRITRTGAFIRKTRIDELPQLINVLTGSMSFVGPRPERPEFVGQLASEIPYYDERHIVKPGITGWAQLLYPYGSSIRDAYQKQFFDMYYVKNQSIFLDLLILLQTVEVVLFGKGAR